MSSGTREGMNIQPLVICMTDTQANSSVSNDGACGTLSCHSRKDPPVALMSHAARMREGSDGDGNASQMEPIMSVRRLTPRECERLQGFPDDWTLIPWKGRPAEECPDGPRYKAIGNSMAVPVMRWLGERIAMADEIPPEEVEL